MKRIKKRDINIEEKIYLPFIIGLMKERKTFDVCKECFKDDTTHTCCVGCKSMNRKFDCVSRNLNCSLWFCDRTIRKLTFQDLMNLSLIAKDMINNDWNLYRKKLKCIKVIRLNTFFNNKISVDEIKRKSYYGKLSIIYINCFSGMEKLKLKMRLLVHNTKLKIKTLVKGKIYTSQ